MYLDPLSFNAKAENINVLSHINQRINELNMEAFWPDILIHQTTQFRILHIIEQTLTCHSVLSAHIYSLSFSLNLCVCGSHFLFRLFFLTLFAGFLWTGLMRLTDEAGRR